MEFTKGIFAVLVGISLIGLIHRDVGAELASFLDWLHIAPEKHVAILLLQFADKITPERVKVVIAIAIGYSIVRFVEAYGLWNARVWAEWFGILGGIAYLPPEIIEIIRKPNLIHWTILVVNVAIVVYLAYVRIQARQERRVARELQPQS